MPRAAGGQWVLAISTWEVTAGVALSPRGVGDAATTESKHEDRRFCFSKTLF